MIELKPWQFILLALLAFYGLFQLVILPVLQKLIYRRMQASQKRLDSELDFGLPSYALANRKLWIDRLLSDPEVKQTIKTLSEKDGHQEHELHEAAKSYADEIVPSFSPFFYFRFGSWMSKIFLRLFYWIKVGFTAQTEYDKITKDHCVVLVSNHRSNFDPFLLVYMASKRAPISYSAGRWALAFPFRQILHAIGFYIVRSDRMGDTLYHCLLRRYVYLATSQCVPQGLFLEGGLTRDGRMQPLKLGLLNYLLKADGQGNCKDIVFIPSALNYDRIPEYRSLLAHKETGFADKGRFYSLLSFLKFLATVTAYVLPHRHKPYGYACVNFGPPVSLAKWQAQNGAVIRELKDKKRRMAITKLGHDLALSIEKLVPILPTNILARIFATSKEAALSEIELKTRAAALIKKLKQKGLSVFLPKNDEDFALGQGIYILLRENLIEPVGDGRFRLVKENAELLAYYHDTIPD